MRWLFLFVLTLNLGYIAWGLSNESTDLYEDVSPLKNAPPIVLLSELERSVPAGKPDAPDIVEASVQELSSVELAGVDVVSADEASVPASPVIEEVVIAKAVVAEEKVVEVAPAPEQAPAAKETQVEVENCFTLGPFRDLDKLRGFIKDIKTYVVATDFRGSEEKEQALYWVYIKPEASHKKAVEIGKHLKAKKIKDFYIIREGEKLHGLSLGYFKNKAGAYRLGERVKKLGFDTVVEPVFKSYTVYWLDYQLAKDAVIPESLFDKYIQSQDKNKIGRLSRACAG